MPTGRNFGDVPAPVGTCSGDGADDVRSTDWIGRDHRLREQHGAIVRQHCSDVLAGRPSRSARVDRPESRVSGSDQEPARRPAVSGCRKLPGGPVWALCSFGLVELSPEPFKVIRRLSARIGKYSNYLVRLGDHALGVSTRSGKTTTLIDTARFAVTGRIAVNAPEISWPTEAGTTLFSFNFGKARTIGPDLRPIGKVHDIPVGASPLHTHRGIAFLPGDYAAPAGFDSQELFASEVVDTHGSIGFMNL